MPKINQYPGTCSECGGPVAAKAGYTIPQFGQWHVYHMPCFRDGKDAVVVIQTSTGTYTRNAKGLCEDAPCCGCCTV